MSNIYDDGSYLERNPTWHTEHSAWKAGNVERMLAQLPVPARSLVEIGCGAGEILVELKRVRNPVRMVGYDISPQVAPLMEERRASGVEFHNTDLLETDERFDVLLCIDVFEHVEDYFGFMRKLKRHAPYVIFHIPLDLSAQTVARGAPLSAIRDRVGHLHYFTKEIALGALRDTGYEVVDWFYTQGAVDLGDRGMKAALLKWPRKALFAVKPDLAVRLLGGYSMMVLAR